MICLLNSTANAANLHLDWAELALLFSRQILNGPQDLLHFFSHFMEFQLHACFGE